LSEDREAKLADCEARARARGLGAIHWPDPWPTNDVLIARAMIFAGQRGALRRFALTAMRMAFREGVDLGEARAGARGG
jgi:2-hydroxychromene-2-carboxylate isomerase